MAFFPNFQDLIITKIFNVRVNRIVIFISLFLIINIFMDINILKVKEQIQNFFHF